MANPILADVTARVSRTKGVEESATALINGFKAKLDAAVQAAIANGATAEELQPLADLSAEMDTATTDLAAAVAANP